MSSTCPHNMVNFGPLAAEICPVVCSIPVNFNRFRVLAALLHGTVVVGVSQSLRHWTEGATYIRQGGHHVGHWPTLLVENCNMIWHLEVNFLSIVRNSATHYRNFLAVLHCAGLEHVSGEFLEAWAVYLTTQRQSRVHSASWWCVTAPFSAIPSSWSQ